MKPAFSIVIPCLNEKDTIAQAIKDAQANAQKYLSSPYQIIVADNGSTDGSIDLIKRFRSVKLVHVPVRGYGAALHWGILNSQGKYVLFADADLSYPFSNLKKLVPLLKQAPDLVLGSRLAGTIQPGAMPWLHRYLGTPILTWFIRLIYQIPTTDCNSGMRIVKKSFYQTLHMRCSGMEWASELLLKTALKKGQYVEAPIHFAKDKRLRRAHLSTWSDGWRHLKSIILLRPFSLFVAMAIFLVLAVLTLPANFALTSLFILLFVVTFFSWLALKFLEFVIEQKHNRISLLLNSNLLVSWVIMLTIIIWSLVILIPDTHLGSKMILISINAVIFIWTFFIETLKTHLVNRLPDNP